MPVKIPDSIDIHAHAIGNGFSGSGCQVRLKGWHRVLARLMLLNLKLPMNSLSQDLDNLYISRLAEFVKGSSVEKAVILAHEYTRDANGCPLDFGSLYVSNDYVLELCKKYPFFLPGVSIHPARPDALEELDRCVEAGAVLMKCLPNCHNIDCSLPQYKEFWRRMADHKIPLLAHTGGELSLPVYNSKFEDPRILRAVLDQGVTVIAAHCATSSLPFKRNFLDTFISMTKEYPNLYGDISALNSPYRAKHYKKLLDSEVQEHLVYGSDLPIPVSAFWAMFWGFLQYKDYKRISGITNLLELDVQIKQAIGFKQEVFCRASKLIRPQVNSNL